MRANPRQTGVRYAPSPRLASFASTRLLLACGLVFPLLWIAMDVVAALAYDGYDYLDQTISELSAVDAPTRAFWLVGGLAYGLLEIAFAAGVWQAAGRRRALRIVAALFLLHAVINLVAAPFSSMHQREVLAEDGASLSDTLHLVIVAIGAVIFFTQIGLAAFVFGGRFRAYSALTALAMLAFGFITSTYTSEVQDNEPTPWLGVYERVNAFGYMLWIVVFSALLLRLQRPGSPRPERR